ARQPHLPAPGRRRPDPRGAFDLRRPRLSRHRARTCMAQGHRPGHLRLGHRSGGARRIPAVHEARGHHTGAGAGARACACRAHRPRAAERPHHRHEHVRARRQGRVCRRRSSRSGDVSTRIDRQFAALKEEGRAALVTFIMAGDPDAETSLEIIKGLPAAGADLIEIGMPFTDPMADGPAIQAAGLRALKSGQTLVRTLELVRAFRAGDDQTPVVLMGYYNPIYIYGVERFLADAVAVGIDGLIVVDLPPE